MNPSRTWKWWRTGSCGKGRAADRGDDRRRECRSDKYSCPGCEIFPEFLGGAILFLFENPVEVGDIVEPAVVGYFRNGMGRIDQHPGCMAQPDLIQAVDEGVSRSFFDEAAEGYFRHTHQFGYLTQADRLIITVIHILERLLQAPAVVCEMFVRERSVGQCPHVPGNGQIVQD